MGNLKTGNEVSSAWRLESLDNRLAYFLRNLIAVCPQGRIHIGPPIDFFNWDHEGMSVCDGLDGEEGHNLVVTVNKTTG
ncbi:hypothetical protein CAURIC_02265 [Corynebacterium auriscanis]|nr:hypothetical protein CAURIC_02265 [Corynebacterium auriscanis]